MKYPGISSRTAWKRLLLLSLSGLVAWWLYLSIGNSAEPDLVAVDLSGMQHIGPDFNISEFFLDGTNGFNVGREGGGGSDVCCVLLPRQWRPGLSVDLRWEVANWIEVDKARKENQDVVPTFKHFMGQVPVEKYESPDRVVVHFFEGGKARVVVGAPGPTELRHAILPADSRAADSAIAGNPVDEMFTKEELDAMRKRAAERNQKYGDWR